MFSVVLSTNNPYSKKTKKLLRYIALRKKIKELEINEMFHGLKCEPCMCVWGGAQI